MIATQQGEQHQRGPLDAAIAGQVLTALGEPGGLYGVQVRPLWDRCYRVNVLVGADAASVRVAHSYFVEADGEGNIVASSPPVARQYPPPPRGESQKGQTRI